MERVTHRYVGGTAWASIYKVSACGENECKGPIVDRLAAYEDTGLEPEEITTERPACVFYCNRQCNLNGDFCAEGPGCPFELDGAKARRFLLQITQPNTPLPLEDLREMDRDWVWIEWIGGYLDGIKKYINGFGFVLAPEGYVKVIETKFLLDAYGKTWIAYRRKPEEGIT